MKVYQVRDRPTKHTLEFRMNKHARSLKCIAIGIEGGEGKRKRSFEIVPYLATVNQLFVE